MEKFYNVKISFKGERDFNFVLPGYGELTVYAGRDVYVKNLSVSGVEALRQLRPLLLDHQLNAKPDGCYRVIDLSNVNSVSNQVKQVATPVVKSVSELKNDMIKNVGPLDPNEGKEVVDNEGENNEGENNEGEKKETVQTELEKDKILEAPKSTKTNTKKPTNKKLNNKKKSSKK